MSSRPVRSSILNRRCRLAFGLDHANGALVAGRFGNDGLCCPRTRQVSAPNPTAAERARSLSRCPGSRAGGQAAFSAVDCHQGDNDGTDDNAANEQDNSQCFSIDTYSINGLSKAGAATAAEEPPLKPPLKPPLNPPTRTAARVGWW